MIFDSHVHSAASPDSTMAPEEAIATLNKMGLGCTFTDHIEYNTKLEPFFSVDFKKYPSEYIKYKSDTVMVGVELSFLPEATELNRQHASNPDYDFVIGSIHWIDKFDIGANADNTKEWFAKLGEEAYLRFFTDATEAVKTNDFFDSFGHIDYVSRYSTLPEVNVLYDKYANEYDKLLLTLIQSDKVLEFCTKRIADESAKQNLFKIYKRYWELGGRHVTMGSDAHNPQQLGYKFDLAMEMLNEIGLIPVYFKERKMMTGAVL